MVDEEIMDPANFLIYQGNIMKYKKERMAKQAQEEKFKKEHTFEPDTKLTKNRVIKKSVKPENVMRTSVSSINLDGIARKRTTTVDVQEPNSATTDPFDQEKKPKHAELYSKRKRQIDKTDKSKEDYEFERHGQECTFAPKLMTKPKYLRNRGDFSQNQSASQSTLNQGRNQAPIGSDNQQRKPTA